MPDLQVFFLTATAHLIFTELEAMKNMSAAV